ncbi:MAG TPA: vanadium-dependent haloperoxidase [Chthoniobacterales bacterium]|nr:vanadium-dependent haloperoxidase [Chthoniobacterales bacterium]
MKYSPPIYRNAALILAGLACAITAQAAPAPAIDPVRTWNEQAITTVRAKNAIDAAAARLYAMVNIAMYDAVNGIESRHKGKDNRASALVSPNGAPSDGDIYAAAVAAAHAVLVGVYPDRSPIYDMQRDNDLAALGSNNRVAKGEAWGANVGAQVVAARANDGSSPPEPPQPPGSGKGQFRGNFNNPQYRNMQPFGIANSLVYKGPGPADLMSLDYAVAFYVTKTLGNKLPTTDTPEANAHRDATFKFWALGNNTAQPPGAWVQVALDVLSRSALGLEDATRLMALETMAMADTVAPTFLTKYDFHHWRPVDAIHEATTPGDMNDLTDGDPGWMARASAGSPEYWSGHSSFSAAAATVLAGFFCNDEISFNLTGDPNDPNAAGQTRSFSSFSAAAAEAGISRIYGGLHFPFSNTDGLEAGRAIAREILANKLLLLKGDTHFGQCPL